MSAHQERLDELERTEEANKKIALDDWTVGSLDNNYTSSSYWKLSDQYSIDDLLKEYN